MLWQTETTTEQKQNTLKAVESRKQERLTNHTPESALEWIGNLCTELEKRGVEYRRITFMDVAEAIEKQEKRRQNRKRQ